MAPKRHVPSDIAQEISWDKAGGGGGGKKQQKVDIAKAAQQGNLDSQAKENRPGYSRPHHWKVEEESENFKPDKEITHDFKMALMQARTAKGLKQAELAQRVQVPAKVIQEYENGKAQPDGQVISKLNRVLGCTLPKVKKNNKKLKE